METINIVGCWYLFRGQNKFVVIHNENYYELLDILSDYCETPMVDFKTIDYRIIPLSNLLLFNSFDNYTPEGEEEILQYLFGDQSKHFDKSIYLSEFC